MEPKAPLSVADESVPETAGASLVAQSRSGAVTEQSVASLVDCVYRHPRHREIYYQMLQYCVTERTVEEVEEAVEGLPAYRSALQSASTLIGVMLDAGGLIYTEYDAEGAVIDDARVEEVRRATLEQRASVAESVLSSADSALADAEYKAQALALDNAIDDALYGLVEKRTLRVTETGAAVVRLLDPVKRVTSYATSRPERASLYRKLLEFCLVPRTLEEIKGLLDGDPALEPTEHSGQQALHASYFIDRMNESGGLQWDGGWVTTSAGRSYLNEAA